MCGFRFDHGILFLTLFGVSSATELLPYKVKLKMTIERVKCSECDAMMLPQTAAKYGGMCAHCGDMPEWLREERRQYEKALAAGTVFSPSTEEMSSAKVPSEFATGDTIWNLEPEYYDENDGPTVAAVISRAEDETHGNVFLLSTVGSRLNLSFTERFAVCEYQNEEANDWLYAFTDKNLRHQVPEDQHVVQACSCCGVGMLWFPSRFHMPRALGFAIVKDVMSGRVPSAARWLNSGDFSRTSKGRG